MFKIGEFSKLTQVSIRMLRYYDEVGLFKPAEIDRWTEHRKYSVEQIPILNRIIFLRDCGFSVCEIAKILHKEECLLMQLDMKYAEIEKTIQVEQEKLKRLKLAKNELRNGENKLYFDISIKSIPSYEVLSLRRKIPNYYEEETLWQELTAFAKQHQILISNKTFSIYHDKEYKETNVDVELCAPVEKSVKTTGEFLYRITEPIPLMACTMVFGAFSNIAKAYIAFAQWLESNSQYQMNGETRQIVHRGPWNECNPEKYLTELQIPLEYL